MNEALHARLMGLMARHGIGYFDYEGPDGQLVIDADRPDDEHPPVLAHGSGIFLSRHPAERSPAAWPRRVVVGDVLGWLKIGPLLEPVTAVGDGTVRRPRLDDGTLAGFGDRLF